MRWSKTDICHHNLEGQVTSPLTPPTYLIAIATYGFDVKKCSYCARIPFFYRDLSVFDICTELHYFLFGNHQTYQNDRFEQRDEPGNDSP